MCKNVLQAYSSAKIIKKSNKFFQSYDHKCTATFFMNHSVQTICEYNNRRIIQIASELT